MFKISIVKVSAAAMAALFLFSSCASIVSKSKYPLTIDSSPSGANVTITDLNGLQVVDGTTPMNVRLKASAGYFKHAEYQIRISKPGFDDRIIFIEGELDGWYVGNLFSFGLVGFLIVDPITGAMWKMEQRYINETLYESKTSSSAEPVLKIYNIDDVPEEWKSHMVKIN